MLSRLTGKRFLLVMALCFLLSACGSGGGGNETTGIGDSDNNPGATSFNLTEVTDILLTQFGSQDAATDVLLQAIDNEYSVQQLLDAVQTESSVLESDGFIFDSKGDVIPGNVLLTTLANNQLRIGLRAIFDSSATIPEIRDYLRRQALLIRPAFADQDNVDRFGASDLLLALFLRGYSGTQIQQAFVFGYSAVLVGSFPGTRTEVTMTIHLRDERGGFVEPEFRKNDVISVELSELDVEPSEVLPVVVQIPPVTSTSGYVLNRIEIPEDFFRTEGSVVCDTTVLETQRTYECVSAGNPDLLDFVIEHTYVINTDNGDVFAPGSFINIDVTAVIDGYSFGFSVGNTISARFEPGTDGFFGVTSHTGKGIGTSIGNGDLPATGNATLFETERSGREMLTATISGKVPITDADELRIVLRGGNGASVVVYHLCRQGVTC